MLELVSTAFVEPLCQGQHLLCRHAFLVGTLQSCIGELELRVLLLRFGMASSIDVVTVSVDREDLYTTDMSSTAAYYQLMLTTFDF